MFYYYYLFSIPIIGGIFRKMNYSIQTAKHRTKQLFKYLEALNHHRNPAVQNVEEYTWKLWIHSFPKHPNLKLLGNPTDQLDLANLYDEGNDIDLEKVLIVKRPQLKDCPQPSKNVEIWLQKGWESPFNEVQVIESKPKEIRKESFSLLTTDHSSEKTQGLEYFADDENRVKDYESWLEKRKLWAEKEKESRKVMKIYEDLYNLYRLFKREPDRFELVLGDGVIAWSREEGRLYHPLLIQQVQLKFDPEKAEFTIVPSDRPSEFYSQIFHSNTDIDASSISDAIKAVNEEHFHPLSGTDVDLFLKSLITSIASRGEYIEDSNLLQFKQHPQIARKPVLFLRNKGLGFASCIEKILEDIEGEKEPSSFFKNIVGIGQESYFGQDKDISSEKATEPKEVLLGKESNEEQIKIAESLEIHDSVLVQGPPGTGKSHTIANLIGHLLAQGKRVLVTSQNSKPLRVLRGHMAKELRSLAVSVLQNDLQAKKDLESSVSEIVEKLTNLDPKELSKREKNLINKRERILSELNLFKAQLIEALKSEYTEIVVEGQTFSPSDAGKMIAKGFEKHSWLPDPDKPNAHLPITQDEFKFLFELNGKITVEEEAILYSPLPELSKLLTMEDFLKLKTSHEKSKQFAKDPFDALWASEKCSSSNDIEPVWDLALKCLEPLSSEDGWKIEVLYDGYLGGARLQPWEDMLQDINNFFQTLNAFKPQRIRLKPAIEYHKLDMSKEEIRTILKEIIDSLGNDDDEISAFRFLLRPRWKKVIDASCVSSRKPKNREHFKALFTKVDYEIQKDRLLSSLRELCPTLPCIGKEMSDEDFAHNLYFQVKPILSRHLNWYSQEFSALMASMENVGFRWEQYYDSVQGSESRETALKSIKESLENLCHNVIPIRIKNLENKEVSTSLNRIVAYLEDKETDNNRAFIAAMKSSISQFDDHAYENLLKQLQKLHQMKPLYEEKQRLIEKIYNYSHEWGDLLKRREGIWGEIQPPGNLSDAWLWKQLQLEVRRINQISIEDLQEKIRYRQDLLKEVTNKLISTKSWRKQIERTTPRERGALVAYTQIIKKLGKTGRVKHAAALLKDARVAMNQCIRAVPVWIMPLIKVAESFDPRTTSFDVVIIDEASQCDVMAFIAVYLGKKILIVGDDEQVSPLAIGQKLDIVHKLMDQYLQDIPVKVLYDGTASIYDIAKRNSGKAIALKEHFRSVPEIIQFSNRLSYNGNILPLRESSSTDLKPPVVPFRIQNGYCEGKINSVEAKQIASIVAACTKIPKYRDKSIGIISLYGDEQTTEIEKYLREYISEDVYERHEILCGSPYHFQGDERDVIFLSIVYSSPENPPLSMIGEGYQGLYKKRFNVATSRARDQMWVVYSLDPFRDLKPGDLRRQLIEYSLDPTSWEITIDDLEKRTESPFEREVLQDLVRSGFDITPQWKVGAYRIDMVAQSNGKKVAIECDGERYHTPETLIKDISRQNILERLGWTFIRIRGSEFYSNKTQTMERVKEKLDNLGIERTRSLQDPNSNKNPIEYNREISEIARIASIIQSGEKNVEIPDNLLKQSTEIQEEETYVFRVSQKNTSDVVNIKGTVIEKVPIGLREAVNHDSSFNSTYLEESLGREEDLEYTKEETPSMQTNDDSEVPFSKKKNEESLDIIEGQPYKGSNGFKPLGHMNQEEQIKDSEDMQTRFVNSYEKNYVNTQDKNADDKLKPTDTMSEVPVNRINKEHPIEDGESNSISEAKGKHKSRKTQKSTKNTSSKKAKTKKTKATIHKKTNTKDKKPNGHKIDPSQSQLKNREPEFWFALAHWAKENDKLNGTERRFAFQVGRYISNQWSMSEKQENWANQIYDTSLSEGFNFEDKQKKG